MRNLRARRDLFFLAAGGVYIATFWLCRDFSIDDAFIAYRYARHLAAGVGPVMNAGEHVEGVSNLPWTLGLGAVAACGLDPARIAPWLALVCGLATLAVVRRLSALWSNDARAGGVAALVCACGAPLAVWSASGMETAAFTLLVTLLYLQASSLRTKRRTVLTGLLTAGVASMRPEGVLFALPIALANVLGFLRRRMPSAAVAPRVYSAGWLWLVAGLGIAALLWFRTAYYGDWLPNSARAKAVLSGEALAPGALYAGKMLLAVPLATLALWPACARLAAAERVLLLTWIFVTVAFAWGVGGERFPGHRFLVPALPALAIAVELALGQRPGAALPRRLRWPAAVLAVVGLALTVRPAIAWPFVEWLADAARTYRAPEAHQARLLAETRFLGVQCLGIALGAGLYATQRRWQHGALLASIVVWMLLPMVLDPALIVCRAPDPAARYGKAVGLWLRQHAPLHTLVATNAAGALPYYSQLPVIDMLGLTDAHIARAVPVAGNWLGHQKGDGAYVLARRPDMIILGGPEGSVAPWPFPGDQQIAASAVFRRDYRLERMPLAAGFEFVYYARRDGRAPRGVSAHPAAVAPNAR